jgi:hypothetical protein
MCKELKMTILESPFVSRTAAAVPEHQVQDVCIVGIRVAAGVRVLLEIGAADNKKNLRAHDGGHLRVP